MERVGSTLQHLLVAAGIALVAAMTMQREHAISGDASPRDQSVSFEELVKRVQSATPLEGEQASVEFRKRQSQIVRELCNIAMPNGGAQPSGVVRRRAILLLPAFGPRETVPFLVANIDCFAPPMFAEGGSLFLTPYPCAIALIEIGQSSAAGILSHLQTGRYREINEKAIELYARTLLAIYRADNADHREAIEAVRRARERAVHKDGLDRLLKKLEEITKDYD